MTPFEIKNVDSVDDYDNISDTSIKQPERNAHETCEKIATFVGDLDSMNAIFSKFTLVDDFFNLFWTKSDILNSIDDLLSNTTASKEISLSKRSKNSLMAMWIGFRRTVSFVDLFTDAYLLYLVSRIKMMSLTIVLSISIVCPYIVSYSCAIKLFFMNSDRNSNVYDNKNNNGIKDGNKNKNKNIQGLKKLFKYLGISPIGVFYLICLDFIDIIFSYYTFIVIFFFGKSEFEMKLLQETVANQLGMSIMDYEGLKRQRAVTMLMYETIPQAIIQMLLIFGLFTSDTSDDTSDTSDTNDTNVTNAANIDETSVYTSVCFAVLNSIFQILRLRSEAQAVREPFYQYCLQCLMARISWIPFKNEIVTFLSGDDDEKRDKNKYISYNIKYPIPCGISSLVTFKPKVGFDFSSITINQFISIVDLPSKYKQKTSKTFLQFNKNKNNKNNKNHKNNKRKDIDSLVTVLSMDSPQTQEEEEHAALHIDFGKSLRLVNFEDLVNLLETCSKRNIIIDGLDNNQLFNLLSNSIDISRDSGKHISNGKNLFGKPYPSSIYSLSSVFETNNKGKDLRSTMLEVMISKDFDMNSIDNVNGETIVFDLIRNNDISNFNLLLKEYVTNRKNKLMLNYHNRSGISPLYLAIRQFIKIKEKEQKLKRREQIKKQTLLGAKDFEEKDRADDQLEEKKQRKEESEEKHSVNNQHIYQTLINNGIENACLNFPAFEQSGVVRSILGYVLLRREWKLASQLIKHGAILNAAETSILVELYSTVSKSISIEECDEMFDVLNNVITISDIDITHLCDSNGNNPIHRIFINIAWKQDVLKIDELKLKSEEYSNFLNRLIDTCPQWLLMENKEKKMAIEYSLKSIYTITESPSILYPSSCKINLNRLRLFNSMMDSLEKRSVHLYNNLIEYRINESKTCIYHLRIICTIRVAMNRSKNVKRKVADSKIAMFGKYLKDSRKSMDSKLYTDQLNIEDVIGEDTSLYPSFNMKATAVKNDEMNDPIVVSQRMINDAGDDDDIDAKETLYLSATKPNEVNKSSRSGVITLVPVNEFTSSESGFNYSSDDIFFGSDNDSDNEIKDDQNKDKDKKTDKEKEKEKEKMEISKILKVFDKAISNEKVSWNDVFSKMKTTQANVDSKLMTDFMVDNFDSKINIDSQPWDAPVEIQEDPNESEFPPDVVVDIQSTDDENKDTDAEPEPDGNELEVESMQENQSWVLSVFLLKKQLCLCPNFPEYSDFVSVLCIASNICKLKNHST